MAFRITNKKKTLNILYGIAMAISVTMTLNYLILQRDNNTIDIINDELLRRAVNRHKIFSNNLSRLVFINVNKTPELGVNVYGWMRGDFGGGTTSRAMVNTLSQTRIHLATVDIGGALWHSHSNNKIDSWSFSKNTNPHFFFDLILVNAEYTETLLQSRGGLKNISQQHYRIGVWHWETNAMPQALAEMGRYYHELWAPSTYVRDAIVRSPGFPPGVPVLVLPYGYEDLPLLSSVLSINQNRVRLYKFWDSIVAGKIKLYSVNMSSEELMIVRSLQKIKQWSLESTVNNSTISTVVFLIVFDFNSDYNRKNIKGAIISFLKAFQQIKQTNRDVGLIIKAINIDAQPLDFQELVNFIAAKKIEENGIFDTTKIILLSGTMSSQELDILKGSVDCYVSLHRSEGLGLSIQDAVLRGIPVIASAFGGSEEFMKPLYSAYAPELRIPIELVPVNRKFGPYTKDMFWAEPNIKCAIFAMRQVFSYPEYYRSVAEKIRNRALKENLSPIVLGRNIENRLSFLYSAHLNLSYDLIQ